ncbi:hypothetical protein [Kibdelosporangium aridum]|uniref:hypothetical protein n=1 Tax=Kibdelosporangium aridum TaxID=2030 RepID=UPI000691A544
MSHTSPSVSQEFVSLIKQIVSDQAPPLFAVVLEYGEGTDAEIIAWGIALDDSAYMITADGRNQYALAKPENALNYVRSRTNTTPHLVWAKS